MWLFDLIELPFCKVVRVDPWNAGPRRYFLAYRAQGGFRNLMGLSVTKEFATFSSPIFFTPAPLLGKIYNTGISLGYLRSKSQDIDTGWPPVCVGLDDPAPELPVGWEEQLLTQIKESDGRETLHVQIDEYHVQHARLGAADVFATSAPLLPKQLHRLCQISPLPFSLAFSTGNLVIRSENHDSFGISAISEHFLAKIINQIRLFISID